MLNFRSRTYRRIAGRPLNDPIEADPSREVHIEFEIQYTECDLANPLVEKKPILKVFMGSDFNRTVRDGEANILLDENDLTKTYKATLRGTLRNEDIDNALIGISHYAEHRNDQQVAGYQDCGMSHMVVGQFLEGPYDQQHDLIMRTVMTSSGPLKKGSVRMRVRNVRLGPGIKRTRGQRIKQVSDDSEVQTLAQYNDQCYARDQSIPDTLSGTLNIRAPMDISPLGIEMTRNCFLPIAAYDMFELPVTNTAFWENSAKIAMERKRLNIHEHWHDMDNIEKNRLYGRMIALTVQVMNYFSDVAYTGNRNNALTRNHLESMGIELMGTNTNAADCEDDASMMMLLHKAFQRMDFSDASGLMGDILRELQSKIANNMIAALLLAVVHGAKVGDATESYGAHMYCGFFTKDMVEKALAKSPQGRALLTRMREPQLLPGTNSLNNGISEASETFPVPMFLEGTGIIDQIGYHYELLDEMKYLAMEFPESNTGKMEIPYEGNGAPSPFYVSNLLAVTSHYSDNYNVNIGSFIIGTENNNKKVTRGHAFTDFTMNKGNMVWIPQPEMPPNVLKTVKEAIRLQPPPHEYIYDVNQKMEGPDKHPDLERFVAAVAKKNRVLSNPKKGPVDKFFQPQNLSEKLINVWIDRLPQLQRICKVSYAKEQFTNTSYCYRVSFFIE